VLQCDAVRCSVLQCVAVCCNVSPCVTASLTCAVRFFSCRSMMQNVACVVVFVVQCLTVRSV